MEVEASALNAYGCGSVGHQESYCRSRTPLSMDWRSRTRQAGQRNIVPLGVDTSQIRHPVSQDGHPQHNGEQEHALDEAEHAGDSRRDSRHLRADDAAEQTQRHYRKEGQRGCGWAAEVSTSRSPEATSYEDLSLRNRGERDECYEEMDPPCGVGRIGSMSVGIVVHHPER